MHSDETTLAEVLSSAGYHTGIFGKWHLGDNYPLRAIDQGFQESLTLNGGGIGQPSDPPGGESYFDPMLRRNGTWVKRPGYISDIITDGAIEFIRRTRSRPFFAYLAFNAPHTPLQVPPHSYAKSRAVSLAIDAFAREPRLVLGHPIAKDFDPDTTSKIYSMVENIDDNVGRLLSALDELGLEKNTVVIFLTDNGPQQPRYNAGLLQVKGTVYEGGIRVPLFVRWPGRLAAGLTLDRIAAHIDITPTVLDICGISAPSHIRFDGRSLLPLLQGEAVEWQDRMLFFQWHRGDAPELGRAFAVRTQHYKLLQPMGYGNTPRPANAPLLLFDMLGDALEERNIASARPELVERLRREYEAWFRDVTSERDYSDDGIARIALGAPEENPVRLTRQDWRGPTAGWTPKSVGYWQVHVQRAGTYRISVRFAKLLQRGAIMFALGGVKLQQDAPMGATMATFAHVPLPAGVGTLVAHITQGDQILWALDVVITRIR